MSDQLAQIITVFLGFFAIMNPIANTAAFAGLVGERSRSDQVKIAAKALILTFIIILLFSYSVRPSFIFLVSRCQPFVSPVES